MDLTDELRAFVATAKTGSFTAAADQLGVSNRLTSKYVAELEKRLGVRLLQRTTRKVGLTPSGETLLARLRRCWTNSTTCWSRSRTARAASPARSASRPP